MPWTFKKLKFTHGSDNNMSYQQNWQTGSPAKYQGCPKILITKIFLFAYTFLKI